MTLYRENAESRGLLCVLAKTPTPGQAKTRLGRHLGDETAAALALAFLEDVWTSVHHLEGVEPVLVLNGGSPPCGLPRPSPVWDQGEGDLGERMERCLRRGAERHPWIILIGSDSPGLPRDHLKRAISLLSNGATSVLGPAEDGGFYLLGVSSAALRRAGTSLLSSLPWSTSTTLAETTVRLTARGLTPELLEPWFDVDELADAARLGTLVREGRVYAPKTKAILDEICIGGADHRDATRARVEAPRVSVVVPVLNEAHRIARRIEELNQFDFFETIVVDGGSTDDSRERVARHPHIRLLRTPPGRARQMNAGAALARGEVLLFLHADTQLPSDAATHIDRAMSEPKVVAGAFRTWTIDDQNPDRSPWWLHLADVRSRYTGLPYGDQALFVRRTTFEALGGFPDIPLMEDLEMSIRLRRVGSIRTVPASVRVSGRRFLRHPIIDTLLVNLYPALYRLGVSPAALAAFYRHVR